MPGLRTLTVVAAAGASGLSKRRALPPGPGWRCWPAFPRSYYVWRNCVGRLRGDVRGQARALLADLLDWHRREDKPAWWRYFYLRTLSPAELTGEPDALGGLTGGDVVGQVKKSVGTAVPLPAAGT